VASEALTRNWDHEAGGVRQEIKEKAKNETVNSMALGTAATLGLVVACL
jgi:hypothetical protein